MTFLLREETMRRAHLLLVVAAVGLLASPAAAVPPAKGTFNFEAQNVVSDLCAFDITVVSVVSGRFSAVQDKNGVVVRVEQHLLEQDTFSANGKSLAGIPYRFSFSVRLDASGNPIGAVSTGNSGTVPLPDGGFFHVAGRIDFFAHGMPGFWLASPGQRGDGQPRGLLRGAGALKPSPASGLAASPGSAWRTDEPTTRRRDASSCCRSTGLWSGRR